MKKRNGKELLGEILQIADKNSPAILTGCVCAGVIGTIVAAWINAPKAKKIIDNYKEDVEELKEEYGVSDEKEDLKEIKEPKTEAAYTHNEMINEYKEKKAELTAKMAIGVGLNVAPVVVLGGTTIACAICANTVSTKRIAALTASYSIAEKALTEYRTKVTEVIGPDKDEEVKAAVCKDKIADAPVDNNKVIVTGAGDVLCFDTYSGRYFKSNADKIRAAVNDLNEQLMNEYYISLNEFYNMIGLPDIKLGYDIGFCIDSGQLRMYFKSILNDDDVPVLVLNYEVSPKYKASRSYGD